MKFLLAVVSSCMLYTVAASTALAADAQFRKERVAFEKGASSATVRGSVKGDETVDYMLNARAGQKISVSLKGSNGSNYFNVLPPGSNDVAMHVGQDGGDYAGTLPDDGDYIVRVYLMRNAARRGDISEYALTIGVAGAPLKPLAGGSDALVPGTRFHASSMIPCLPSPYGDAKEQVCDVGVVRRGRDGTGTVEIRSAGFVRRILFVAGKPVAADTFQKMTNSREDDTTTVRFDDGSWFKVFDSLLTGG